MKNSKFILFFLFSLVLGCKKDKVEPQSLSIQETFSIESNDQLWFRDGIIYKDEYIVWADDLQGNRTLKSYNLNTKQENWSLDYNDYGTWGARLKIHNDVLVIDLLDRGLTLISLIDLKIISSVMYGDFDTNSSYTYATFHEDKVYKALHNAFDGISIIYSVNIETGELINEYEWTGNPESRLSLSSPLIYENENTSQKNFITLLRRYNETTDLEEYDILNLINLNEDKTLNWLDTLEAKGDFRLLRKSLPVIFNDNLIAFRDEDLVAYNLNNGTIDWSKKIEVNKFVSDLLIVGDEVYLREALKLSKIDPLSGDFIWQQDFNNLPPSTFGNFQVTDEFIVYTPNNFGDLILLNKSTGGLVNFENPSLNFIANPKYYQKEDIFITHNADGIIGFRIE